MAYLGCSRIDPPFKRYLFFGSMKWYQIIFLFTFQYPDSFLLIWVISAQEVIYIKSFVMLEKFSKLSDYAD